MEIKSYDNIFLPSNNIAKSKMFYSEILGLETKFDFSHKGMIAFKIGNEEPAIIIKDKNKFPNAQPTVWFEVDEVKNIYNELKKKNIKFLTEPFKIKTGWAVEFVDPDGNQLGLTDYK